ncbi:vWA domain-containing protein [Allosphingosinicella deserti]|uniref:VWA domain-containing protein n=1 Tax=Allosphingosinicella deserti TaxID=2116704 RepID=A0A2P7QND5_9SPHN|nr:VWA domain-containing protein [Sphingomonas deserti]PSJ39485.1 VWA domain-containing protein [Sphingomonas deserti]
MLRLHPALTAGIAAAALAACARSGVEQPSAPPEPALAAADQNITVTGQRVEAPVTMAFPDASVAEMAPVQGIVAAPSRTAKYAPLMEQRFAPPPPPQGRDRFTATPENPFRVASEDPVSTFSIDVDTASYAFVRASLAGNVLPQKAAVRTEEMINYFPYDYRAPRSAAEPFSSAISVFPSPWSPGRKLVRIGIKGYAVEQASRPRANLVFLVDTSGSMNAPNRLPLVRQALSMLLDRLHPDDSVGIVTYAGTAGTALEPTSARQKARIRAVIDSLGAGGSTAGAEGIRQAYALAARNFDPKGVNRVILATDGDFNVGITSHDELKGFVERERSKGVFLSVLGFGMGNYNDALMQALAQNGNGAAAYIDTVAEARKTLVDEATSTLFPIAKDVKIQVEFNPARVAEYRLIGYETRLLQRDDFDNDKVDAGEVGSGQSVTALYEIVPVGGPRVIAPRRYGESAPTPSTGGTAGEYGFVKIRYKLPKSDTSRLISTPIDRRSEVARFADAPEDARFAAGVAGFAELLRGGRYTGAMGYEDVLQIVSGARGRDDFGYRAELLQLIRAAQAARSLPS